MARKLFSLENDDTGTIGEDMVEDSVGEVADAQTDVIDDTADIDQDVGGVEEGIDATAGLDQVEDLVEDAVENGEGLDAVAAEAVRIAVEAICSRVGANPKAIYSLYATENFSSPSARKSNSSIALEGVREFLKDMWAKIKASLTNIWGKVKAFWAKHVSTLGRVKKALESMKAKASASTGKLDGKAYVEEAPSGLVSAFAGKDDISAKVVEAYIANHEAFTKTAVIVNGEIAAYNGVATSLKDVTSLTDAKFDAALTAVNKSTTTSNTEKKPLIGGVIYKLSFETTSNEEESSATMTIERENIDSAETKLGLTVASKDQIKDVLNKCVAVINETIKVKEKADKTADAVDKAMNAITKVVNATDPSGNDDLKGKMKAARNQIKTIYSVNAKLPTYLNDQVSMNIKLAKAVLGFSAFCLKQYK